MRDWLDVSEPKEFWTVYGLMLPDTKQVFYVGITNGPAEERLAQHRADRTSAVWGIIHNLLDRGLPPTHCVFATTTSEAEARHLEDALIIAIPLLFNRTLSKEAIAYWRLFPLVSEVRSIRLCASPERDPALGPSRPYLAHHTETPIGPACLGGPGAQ